jgi:type IV secretion system protein VirB11
VSARLTLAEDAPGNVFLAAYLAPFGRWLDQEEVSELLVNRPGELWVERDGGLERHSAPEIDDAHLQRLAAQIARFSHQGVSREHPLLAATLPDGARVQMVAPSATRGHWALAIRRHRLVELELDAYDRGPLTQAEPAAAIDPATHPVQFLRGAVRARRTILVSGGTSTGKTTFLNALLREIPAPERLVLVEDTPEIRPRHANWVGLVAVKGELGEALVSTDDLLQASLRLRPDRIVLGELRGAEAVSFLRAINTGHPGSFTTVHANSCDGALDQLALMTMQAGLGLSRTDTREYAKRMIDIVVQLDRVAGERRIREIRLLHDGAAGSA